MDIYAALPSITGKLELEYEGELKGGDAIARELIRLAVGKVYTRIFDGENMSTVIQWFEMGGSLKLDETQPSSAMIKQLSGIQGLLEKTKLLGLGASEPDAVRAAAAEFILEGLYAHRRISRNEEIGYTAEVRRREPGPDDPKAKASAQELSVDANRDHRDSICSVRWMKSAAGLPETLGALRNYKDLAAKLPQPHRERRAARESDLPVAEA